MNRNRLFDFNDAQGCAPAIAGVVLGVVLFVVVGFLNFFVTAYFSVSAHVKCDEYRGAGIIEVGLTVLTAIVAWMALFGTGNFGKLPSWFRFSLLTMAALLLVPWPCSFTSIDNALLIRCEYPFPLSVHVPQLPTEIT